MLQGGVDLSLPRAGCTYDGVGRTVAQRPQLHRARLRRARGASAAPIAATPRSRSCKPGDVDWDELFGERGRALVPHRRHLRGAVARRRRPWPQEAMAGRAKHGTLVSYDLNYRDSLWKSIGGQERAREVNRALVPLRRRAARQRGGLHGRARLRGRGRRRGLRRRSTRANFRKMIEKAVAAYPELPGRRDHAAHRALGDASTTGARSAGTTGKFYEVARRDDLEILDRVGGGDSFASGLIYGLLAGKDPQWAVECGVAHGALAMTTPGDTTMATPRRGGARDEGRRRPRAAVS